MIEGENFKSLITSQYPNKEWSVVLLQLIIFTKVDAAVESATIQLQVRSQSRKICLKIHPLLEQLLRHFPLKKIFTNKKSSKVVYHPSLNVVAQHQIWAVSVATTFVHFYSIFENIPRINSQIIKFSTSHSTKSFFHHVGRWWTRRNFLESFPARASGKPRLGALVSSFSKAR